MRIVQLVVSASLSALLTSPVTAGEAHSSHWGYEGHGGPAHWGGLSKEFAACGKGHRQSPINIETQKSEPADLHGIAVHYKPTPIDVVNNGHTIQVNLAKGSTITVGEHEYELVQFHFHAPSEHTLDGKHADMAVHLVHKAEDGRLGVIGVLMNKGAEHIGLKELWSHLPQKAGDHVQVDARMVDPALFLPGNLSYAAYSGSLTTPPCTEEVSWMVMTTTTTLSEAQLSQFTALFSGNNRPVQPLHGREVKFSH